MSATIQNQPRPTTAFDPVRWLRQNLFSSWFNSLLTLVALWITYRLLVGFIPWILSANWQPVITRPLLYLVGQYPEDQLWRIGVGLLLIAVTFGLSWGTWGGIIRNFAVLMMAGFVIGAVVPLSLDTIPVSMRLLFLACAGVIFLASIVARRTPIGRPRWTLLVAVLSFALFIFLLRGSPALNLPLVETSRWGGLMVNLLVAAIGIVASLPIGILLALGRRSQLPVLKLFSTLFIEIVRGVPLVTILFMGSVMLPLFLPEEVRIDRLIRALLGITLFSAAYMAENVRGGLQAIPQGQYEAAKAIGLNAPLTTLLIVLPQALRLVIPAIVGQFISLFKDTTLLLIVGIIEILNVGKSVVLGNPEFIGAIAEVYLFIAAVFWVFTYAMSYSSRRLERALGVGER